MIGAMTTRTLSPKFQVAIPKHIREALQPTAGMPMQASGKSTGDASCLAPTARQVW